MEEKQRQRGSCKSRDIHTSVGALKSASAQVVLSKLIRNLAHENFKHLKNPKNQNPRKNPNSNQKNP
jgi:hypothetical protein